MATVRKDKRCPHGNAGQDSGRCSCNWVVTYRDEHGSQRQKSYLHDQKTLANSLATKAEHARMAGEPVYPERCRHTFGEYAERAIRMSPVGQRTQQLYLGSLRNHLGPLAGRNLADVARDRTGITSLLTVTLPASGYGRDTVQLAQTVITSVMNAAVANGDIDAHRLARIKLPRPSEDESVDPALIEKLDRNALETITAALPPRLALAAWLSFGCGLRVSEALGVRLADFSDDLTTLTVARQVLNGNRMIPLKARDPGHTRTVPVPVWAAQRLTDHVERFGITDYLFPGARTRYTPRTTMHRRWEKAREAAGWPTLRYHDLRHAWCSHLIRQRIPITEVAKMAGHRNSAITETIYHHMVRAAFDDARDALNAWT
jgi:integrase